MFKFKKNAMKDKFITSIFNYCDRWCEKCTFTDRCRTYAMSAEWEANNPEKKGDWVAQLSDSFSRAMSMLKEMAEREGIDLENLPEYIPPTVSPKLIQGKEQTLDLIKSYENAVREWKAANKELVEEWSEALFRQREIGINSVEEEFNEVQSAYETVSWYNYFMQAKVVRAYSSLEDDMGIEEDPIQNDMNGSTKIAVIAIERSLGAWEIIRKHFEGEGDTIIDIMVTLARMKKRILSEFPYTMQFVRPGFDTHS